MERTIALLTALALASAPVLARGANTKPAPAAKKPAPAPAPAAAPPPATAAPPAKPAGPTREEAIRTADKKRFAGMVTTLVGASVFVVGVIILIAGAAADEPQRNAEMRRGLDLGGGLFASTGAAAAVAGALVWFDGAHDLKEARAKSQALLGLSFRF